MMRNSVSKKLNISTLNRALFAIALGVLMTGFAEKSSAGLIGSTHTVTKAGGTFNSSFGYGVDNAVAGNPIGSSSFESTGGSGLNFFVYFANNSGNPDDTLRGINGGNSIGWGASNLAAAFPPAGLSVASIIPLIPGSDRNSALFSAVTHLAPNGGLFVASSDASSFTLGIPSGATSPNGSIVGYEITLQSAAVPEPSTLVMLLTGGIGLMAFRVRRKRNLRNK